MYENHLKCIQEVDSPSIIDRLYYSEFVYGRIFRGNVYNNVPNSIPNLHFMLDPEYIIICLPKFEVWLDLIKPHEHGYDSMTQLIDVYKAFEILYDWQSHDPRVIKYDWTEDL